MKKKNLIVLLLMPFIISTLCIVTVNVTYEAVAVDILSIDWNYDDLEPFKLGTTEQDSLHKLNAVGKNYNYTLAEGNELVWSCENKDSSITDPIAEIVFLNGQYYLKTNKTGEVIVTCSNEKGNVSRKMTAVIYDSALILIQPAVQSSQNNIDPVIYYGQYDLNGTQKVNASISLKITTIPASIASTLTCESSENVSCDLSKNLITVNGTGDATVTVRSTSGIAEPATFGFRIVENGVNVYSYNDLLNCTNKSQDGEIVVLRKNFESVDNAYIKTASGVVLANSNTECFGNYNHRNNSFSFASEIYSFTTTYNKNYIDQWNEFVKTNKSYSAITDKVNVGLRVQKDFYGNGYTLNLHNLAYPSSSFTGSNGQSIPALAPGDLFRGPLPFYTLGDPHDTPLVSALGQDNIGMYVDGNGITVNDVNIKNCDFGDRVANLDTVGTVLEVFGNDVIIKNSRMSNGKNVVRAFSSMNLLIDNCMMSNSRNFLFTSGSNEYLTVTGDNEAEFTHPDGSKKKSTLNQFINPNGELGDGALNSFLLTDYTSDANKRAIIKELLLSVQEALNDVGDIANEFKGTTTINDCFFYKSGIASIAMESFFNGPYLYNGSPSLISTAFKMISGEGKDIVPYTALGISGVSYPVKLDVTGDTRFYDYKTANQMDLSGLIDENISAVANEIFGEGSFDLTVDDIFPLKTMVMQRAQSQGCVYNDEGERYINVPVAYYGGGLNLSVVNLDGINYKNNYTLETEVDLLETYLNLKGGSSSLDLKSMKNLMLKTVTTVIGYEPFTFRFVRNGYLLNETPKVSDLIANAKGV